LHFAGGFELVGLSLKEREQQGSELALSLPNCLSLEIRFTACSLVSQPKNAIFAPKNAITGHI